MHRPRSRSTFAFCPHHGDRQSPPLRLCHLLCQSHNSLPITLIKNITAREVCLESLQLHSCSNSCVSGRTTPQGLPSRASKCKILDYFPGWLWHHFIRRGRMGIRQNPSCALLLLLLLLWDQLEQQGTCKGAKRRKPGSKMQRSGEMLRKMDEEKEENAPLALWEKWAELFHVGITPKEESAQGREKSHKCITTLTPCLCRKQNPPSCPVRSGSQLGETGMFHCLY